MRCCRADHDAVAPADRAPPGASPRFPPNNTRATSWPHRAALLTWWAIPVTTLALLPKCPACVAGYVLLFTGIGLSLPAATAVHGTLVALSVTALAYLVFRTAWRALNRPA